MLKEFTKYGKWYDYINLKNFENKIALFVMIFSLILLKLAGFYENYEQYNEASTNIVLYSIAGMFGLLGFSLSGIAIIVSLFSDKDIKRIKTKDLMKKVMSSFLFLAFNIGILIIIYFAYYIIISSKMKLLNEILFWPLIALYVYSIVFIIFYTVSLVRNCVWIYEIKVDMNNINSINKADINEIRIDLILKILFESNSLELDEFINISNELITQSSIEDKAAAIEYLKKRYGYKE